MIIFIYGTTAEAIKLAPVIRRLMNKGVAFEQWLTHQHTEALAKLLPELGLPPADRVIAYGNQGEPLRSYGDVLRWLWSILRWLVSHARGLRRSLPRSSVVVVHGDTMTSVVGAFIARRLKLPSAHVEAGLRSGDWRNPFPEELDRRIVGRWARLHYAPSLEAVDNLKGRPGVVYTEGNTVIDAILDRDQVETGDDTSFGIVLLHRFEFISNPNLVNETMSRLSASPVKLRVLVDAYSSSKMTEAADRHPEIFTVMPKLDHEGFIALARRAEFIVTDSGGVQEEAALLGVPTLVHRRATERAEGLGENAVLSGWDQNVVSRFLAEYARYRRPQRKLERSPSDIVVEDLLSHGFGSR
ncbi:UDP-N-acetylglucosamine 2-epimerase (non-hydrolysing) [Diaminobutyricimonas aerilata]|uniref:UDP-N-acetylglucosamine 2-epimerase (Non-hydrolysing) n=1 Tax=Diaminobutyricimonas aerilata TaxID=1162967 RepID=A0A2M9CH25_9MICO|nr:UDP-N-acetylglucosamine 2-epimerase [Diaminobutyricimonas aerilata]PJJ71226.1 UDP-N-acetylglucosamine 2-epimerase (non-hydrolysing) [Diaminobutyricimonas aerilata]